MSEKLRCMCCMHIVPDGMDTCPYCGQFPLPNQNLPYLPIGTTIANRYTVGKAMYVYAEGVTYIGYDNLHNTIVEIREFLPLNIVKRSGSDISIRVKVDAQQTYYNHLQSFVSLWRTLMRLRKNSAIAHVIDIVTNENLTAYAVTEHIESISLDEYLFSHGLKLSLEKVEAFFIPAIDTLEELHSHNIIHGAISPSTLLISRDNRLIFGGFTIPEYCNEANGYIFHGYSPVECYNSGYPVGTWTDIYAFTACMYHTITGLIPPKATDRAAKDTLMIQREIVNTLPGNTIKILFSGMRILPPDRLKTAAELRSSSPKYSASGTVNLGQDTDDGYVKPEKIAEQIEKALAETPEPAVPAPVKAEEEAKNPSATAAAEPKNVIPPKKKPVDTAAQSSLRTEDVKPQNEKPASDIKQPEKKTAEAEAETVKIENKEKKESKEKSEKAEKAEKEAKKEKPQKAEKTEKVKADKPEKTKAAKKAAKKKKPVNGTKTLLLTAVISFLLLCVLFAVAYPVYLHNLFEIPQLEPLVEVFSFLPGNEDSEQTTLPTVEPEQISTELVQAKTVPNVKKMTYKKASEILVREGFIPKRVDVENPGNQVAERVKSVTPAVGTPCEAGSVITLEVWMELPGATTTASESEAPVSETTATAQATEAPASQTASTPVPSESAPAETTSAGTING